MRPALRSGIKDLAEELMGPPNKRYCTRVEWRWGNKGAFRVWVGGVKQGGWCVFGSDPKGDPIALIMHVRCCDFADAIAWAAAWLDGAPYHRADEPKQREPRSTDTSAYVAKLVEQSVSYVGTLGERYLREHRGITGPLPPEPRFHPGVWSRETKSNHPALLFLARDSKGTVRRVQAVLLDPATGAKAKLESPKLTYGKNASHIAVKFAERIPNQGTTLTTGPEDAICIWSVQGHRTMASLGDGSMDKPRFAAGTDLLLFGDNDKSGKLALRRAAKHHANSGCSVRTALPEHVKDANELYKHSGPDALVAALNDAVPYRAHGLPAYYPGPTMQRDEALELQRQTIRDTILQGAQRAHIQKQIIKHRDDDLARLDPSQITPQVKSIFMRRAIRIVLADYVMKKLPKPRKVLITGSQGSAKTANAIRTVSEIAQNVIVWLTVTNLAKAEENARDYRNLSSAASMPVYVVRGRTQLDPQIEGKRLCWRSDITHRAAVRGISVREIICPACPFKHQCGSMRQEREIKALGDRAFFILARNYLFLPSPAPSADILIADESVIMEARQTLEVSPSVLLTCTSGGSQSLSQNLRKLHDALSQPVPLVALRETGVTPEDIKDIRKSLDKEFTAPDIGVTGAMSDDIISAALDKLKEDTTGAALILVRAILREIDLGRDTLTGIVFYPDREYKLDGEDMVGPRIRVHRMLQMKGVSKAKTTVLALDGTGSPERNAQIFPGIEHINIAIERTAHVTGTIGRSYSRQSMSGLDRHGQPIEAKTAGAKRVQAEIMQIANRMPGKTLVGSNMPVVEAMIESGSLDSEVAAHFGNVRGLNAWEDCESAVSAGREATSIDSLEEIARAFLADDPQPFISYAGAPPEDWPWKHWPYKASRGRRMRDGSTQIVEVEVHPDPRVQDLLEQIREREVEQLIDRTRPIFNRRTITVMNNLALDVTYDRVLTHAYLVAGGSPLELALAETGILPRNAADLHRFHPTRFTESAADHVLKRTQITPVVAKGDSTSCKPVKTEDNAEFCPGSTRGGQPSNKNPIIWRLAPPLEKTFVVLYQSVIEYRYSNEADNRCDRLALIDVSRHPDVKASLEAVLGPLAKCERTSQGDAPQPATAPPEATPTPEPDIRNGVVRPFGMPITPDDDDDNPAAHVLAAMMNKNPTPSPTPTRG
jgi:hypothetical protein